MVTNSNTTPIQNAWIELIDKLKLLMDAQQNDRPLDQFFEFKNAVFVIVLDQEFLKALNDSWNSSSDYPQSRNALLLEIQAFSRSVEIGHSTSKQGKKKWWPAMREKLLGRGSIVTGSVKDILDNLPPFARYGIILLKELIDLFKGNDK